MSRVVIALLIFVSCAPEPGRPSDAETCDAVIDGATAGADHLPQVGALWISRPGRMDRVEYLCTATLVAEDRALTAAHCLTKFSAEELVFAAARPCGGEGGARRVLELRVHPEYALTLDSQRRLPAALAGDVHDLGWVELEPGEGPAPLSILPPELDRVHVHEGTEVIIAGYGATRAYAHDAGEKRIARTTLGEVAAREMIVGGDGAPQKCGGDSGAPTLIEVGDRTFVAGVASRALDPFAECTRPGIDTRVAAYAEFVAK